MIKGRTARLSCLPALLLALVAGARGQEAPSAKLIEVGENVLVGGAADGRPLVEPQVAANPRDPKHLLAVAIAASDPIFSPKQDCAAFASFDGGVTWSRHDFGLEGCGDPWAVLRGDGTAVFAGLLPRGEIRLFRSADGGRSWSPQAADLGRGHDHQTMVVDAGSGPHAGSVYLVSGRLQRAKPGGRPVASVLAARSSDGGKSFGPWAGVVPSNLNLNALAPATLSDGTLVVPFGDFQSNADDFKGAGMLERRRVWALVSADGGQTFSHPMFVSEDCGSGGGFASLAADASAGPFRDRLYLTCVNREKNGVLVHHSSERGEKWSGPVRVGGPAENVVFRRTPTVAVNGDGVVAVTWYERRSEAGRECQHTYFSASADGGKTFLPEVRVSTEASCPDTPKNGPAARRWAAGGDYSGLVAAADGAFHVLWSDSRNGIYQLRAARVRVNATAKQKP